MIPTMLREFSAALTQCSDSQTTSQFRSHLEILGNERGRRNLTSLDVLSLVRRSRFAVRASWMCVTALVYLLLGYHGEPKVLPFS